MFESLIVCFWVGTLVWAWCLGFDMGTDAALRKHAGKDIEL